MAKIGDQLAKHTLERLSDDGPLRSEADGEVHGKKELRLKAGVGVRAYTSGPIHSTEGAQRHHESTIIWIQNFWSIGF